MSFLGYKDIIEEGELVLAFIGRQNIKPIKVTAGETLNTRYGCFPHDDMVGARFGEQIASSKGYGFIHLLHPTPEMWTLSLPHRTQIVYTPDSSYIVQRLGVTAGSRVIEAGTGSGSFSHAFARTVAASGMLFSYEFHEPRYLEAKQEFEAHGLQNCTITHRDVCKRGFLIPDVENVLADSVFLDLPSPWEALPHLEKVIDHKRQVGICCFSPCIEQVMKTVEALKDCGWSRIEMVEIAGRRWEARKDMKRDVEDALQRLRDVRKRKFEGIERLKKLKMESANGERVNGERVNGERVNGERVNGESETKETTNKETTNKEEKKPSYPGFNPFGKGMRVLEGDENFEWKNVSRVETEIKSHTSYLTFAVKNSR